MFKKLLAILIAGTFIFSLVIPAFSQEASQKEAKEEAVVKKTDKEMAKIDHLALAASYEEKAREQDAIISSHTKMRVDVTRFYGLDTSPSGTTDIAVGHEMQRHCDDIIAAAKKLKQEFLDFAQWHKDQARVKNATSKKIYRDRIQ